MSKTTSNRRINVTFEAPDDFTIDNSKVKIDSVYDKVNTFGILNPLSYRVMDLDDEEPGYDGYLLYLQDFIHKVEYPDGDARKESPFTYEEWIMCGKPDHHLVGVRIEGGKYLELSHADGSAWGFVTLEERVAETIAYGISSGRFKVSARGQESETDVGSD